jgi:hypothetical protein
MRVLHGAPRFSINWDYHQEDDYRCAFLIVRTVILEDGPDNSHFNLGDFVVVVKDAFGFFSGCGDHYVNVEFYACLDDLNDFGSDRSWGDPDRRVEE